MSDRWARPPRVHPMPRDASGTISMVAAVVTLCIATSASAAATEDVDDTQALVARRDTVESTLDVDAPLTVFAVQASSGVNTTLHLLPGLRLRAQTPVIDGARHTWVFGADVGVGVGDTTAGNSAVSAHRFAAMGTVGARVGYVVATSHLRLTPYARAFIGGTVGATALLSAGNDVVRPFAHPVGGVGLGVELGLRRGLTVSVEGGAGGVGLRPAFTLVTSLGFTFDTFERPRFF